MDESTPTISEAMNKNFLAKISIVANLNEIAAKYTEDILNGADPILSNELIPVEISDTGKVTKADIKNEWYNYANKKWANAIILLDESQEYEDNEEIPENNIESYFVWVPKYSYQLWDLGKYENLTNSNESKIHTISIKFGLEDTADAKPGECTTPMNETRTQGLSEESGNCEVGDYMTHPAFISMNTNGLWVGKFESGYKGANTPEEAEINESHPEKLQIKPNEYSWRNMQLVYAYDTSYNYKRELDSHMMKNTEWGAIAYLQHSIYGSGKNVRNNNNSAFITGYASTTEPTLGDNPESIEENRYEFIEKGADGEYTLNFLNSSSKIASTTGNFTGIYDMSGGAWEYTMGYSKSSALDESNILSIYPDFYTNVDWEKYYDSYNSVNRTDNYARILGDATGELGPFQEITDPDNVVRNRSSWYKDYGVFVYEPFPWFVRGGFWRDGTGAGIFSFSGHGTGDMNIGHSFRVVLIP